MNEIERLIRDYTRDADDQPVDVENLIVNAGLNLEAAADLSGNISGHIERGSGGGYVIRAAGDEHEYRRRFTMAHELGHFVLHKSILDRAGGVNDSRMYRTERNAPVYNSHIHNVHERQANSFAANLLMPEDAVRKLYTEASGEGGPPLLKRLYKHFKVSPSAMRWRIKNLGLKACKE